MIYIGIDAGLTGALAGYDPAEDDLVFCHEMPTDEIEVNGKKRRRISEARLLEMLGPYYGSKAVIERPEIRPLMTRNKQDGTLDRRSPGAQGMFTFGEAYGVVRMGLIASGIFVVEVRPRIWMKGMRVGAGKDEKRRVAGDRHPRWRGTFTRVKDDGLAEASLIAEWAAQMDRKGAL